jgi:long-chain fatty acid transport protein
MKNSMLKLSTLSAAVLSASTAMAGGFDNSDRSLDILFGDNNVITTSYGQTSVPMKAVIQKGAATSNTVNSGDVVGNFTRPQVAFRYNISEELTCATKFEQPYAASVAYQDDQLAYVVTDANGLPVDDAGNIAVDGSGNLIATPATMSAPIATKYESESITAVCGYDFTLPKGELKVYGGPKIQKVNGAFDEDLNPLATGVDDNLTVELDGGTELGYVVGAAFSIPEIALRASFTYHSQVDYDDAKGTNRTFVPLSLVNAALTDQVITTASTAKTFTPQSVELALQSGIAENTLASLTMRWSEYSKLADLQIQGGNEAVPGTNGTMTLQDIAALDKKLNSLINPEVSMFSNDTLDYELGLGRRINDSLSLGASFSGSIKLGSKPSDTPLGADATSLRLPGDTSHTLSFGGEYAVMPGLKVNGGLGYTFINAYVVQETDNSFKAEFSKTEATSFQMGVSYEI